MTGHYPSRRTLQFIEHFDIIKGDVMELINLIHAEWEFGDWGFKLTKRKGTSYLQLHTGGWSGNEDIIRALEKCKWFYALYWVKSIRGGHYWFEIRPMEKSK